MLRPGRCCSLRPSPGSDRGFHLPIPGSLHRIEAISVLVHPSWDVTFQTGRQKAELRAFPAIFRPNELARRLLYLVRLRNVLLPPRETFCWTERVQERKGLYAFFFGHKYVSKSPFQT